MTAAGPEKPKPPGPPLWRQAFDAAERAVTPRAENLVRTEGFTVGVALLRRAQVLAKDSARGLTARAQIGSLDREVRRLSLQLEAEKRRAGGRSSGPTSTKESHAERAQPADGPRPGPARRRTQRPPGT